tara:strand:+ start:3281 stop:3499 length:219 start_codon:yes stop_codon:yes gene_type:complete
MKIVNDQFQPWQKMVVVVGLLILAISTVIFTGCLLGVLAFDQFSYGGQSGIRTIAGIAISGCLLAAIGYWDK